MSGGVRPTIAGRGRRNGPNAGRLAAAGFVALSIFWLAVSPAAGQVEIPAAPGRAVYDQAGVINQGHVQLLEALSRELLEKTGVALVTVTVPRLEGESIDDFSVRVGTQWGVGREGEDRGVVVAFALEERRIFIATGYGVEGFLPDGKVGGILDQFVMPHLKRNDFSTGLAAAGAAVAGEAAREYGVTITGAARAVPRSRGRSGAGFGRRMIMMLMFFGYMGFFGLFRSARRNRFRRSRAGFYFGGFGSGYGSGGFGGGGFGGFGGGGFGGGGAGRGF